MQISNNIQGSHIKSSVSLLFKSSDEIKETVIFDSGSEDSNMKLMEKLKNFASQQMKTKEGQEKTITYGDNSIISKAKVETDPLSGNEANKLLKGDASVFTSVTQNKENEETNKSKEKQQKYKPANSENIPDSTDNDRKKQIINTLLEDKTKDKIKDKIYERLEKYPEDALKLISDYKVIIQKTQGGLGKNVAGGYDTETKNIILSRWAYVDFFKNHPKISSFLKNIGDFKFLGLGFLPAIAGIPVAYGLATLPFILPAVAVIAPTLIIAEKIRSKSTVDALEHETAHALDFALSETEKYKDIPVDKRVEEDPRILGQYNLKEITDKNPLSLKSSSIINCYLACCDGKCGHRFITEYSKTSILEYFAESVRAYVNTDEKSSDINISTLRQKDWIMYNIIKDLFDDISQGK